MGPLPRGTNVRAIFILFFIDMQELYSCRAAVYAM